MKAARQRISGPRSAQAPVAVALVRASTDRQEGSTDDQAAHVRAWCEREGRELVRVFEDEGVSGSDLNRPGLRALLAHVEDPENPKGAVVAWRRNRLARPEDPRDGLALERRIERAGWTIHYLQGAQATGNALSDAILGLVEHHEGGQYLRTLACDVARGQARAFESGKRCGLRAPYALAKEVTSSDGAVRVVARGVPHRVAKGEVTRWVPGDELEVQTLRRLFDLYATGAHSLTSLCGLLNGEGVPSPSGTAWRARTVQRLLEAEVYLGVVVWGRRASGRYFRRGAHGPVPVGDHHPGDLNPSEPVRHEDAHEPLVDADLFHKVNALLRARASNARGVKHGARTTFPLAGVLVCGCCGSTMGGMDNGRKGYKRQDYVCLGGRTKGTCRRYQLRVARVHEAVLAAVKAVCLPHTAKLRALVLRQVRSEVRPDAPSTDALDREQRALEAKIQRALLNLGEVGPSVAKRLGQQVEAWEARLQTLVHERARVEAERAAVPDAEELVEAALEVFRDLEKTDAEAPRPVLRALLSKVVERLEVRFGPERVKVPGQRGLGSYPCLGGLLTLTPLGKALAEYQTAVAHAEACATVVWYSPGVLVLPPAALVA